VLGALGDPTQLLSQLQSGYRVFTNSVDTTYPYVITDLEPARYVPVPVLTGFGAGGLAMNFQINPLRSVNVEADQTAEADFIFGPVTISGTVTLTPQTPPSGIVYGIVAARHSSFAEGIQAVLMPTVFIDDGSGTLSGHYAGKALRADSSFQLRVFSSLDAQNPITSALAWVMNPFAPEPPHEKLKTDQTDLTVDLNLP
jgi:hypothetical protein